MKMTESSRISCVRSSPGCVAHFSGHVVAGYLYRVGQSRTRTRKVAALPAPEAVGLPDIEPALIPARNARSVQPAKRRLEPLAGVEAVNIDSGCRRAKTAPLTRGG